MSDLSVAVETILELVGTKELPREMLALRHKVNLPFIRSTHYLDGGLRIVTIHRKTSNFLYFGARFSLVSVEVFHDKFGRIEAFQLLKDEAVDGRNPYDTDIQWKNEDVGKYTKDIKNEQLKILKLFSVCQDSSDIGKSLE